MLSPEKIAERALQFEAALIVAPPGFGKTTTAFLIAKKLRLGNLFLIANRRTLERQWRDRARSEGIKVNFISPFGNEFYDQRVPLLIVDEAHHVESDFFYDAVYILRTERRYGLTATPKREIPEIRKRLATLFPYTIIAKPVKKRAPTVLIKETDLDLKNDFDRAMSFKRNEMIADFAEGKTLCLVRLRTHCLQLEGFGFSIWKPPQEKPPKAERVVATYSFVGEGIHIQGLETVIMGTPSESVVRLTQALGRGMQPRCSRIVVLIDNDSLRLERQVEDCARACGLSCVTEGIRGLCYELSKIRFS